ncbi:WD40 repeat-like protein [Serendipita vermifera]|nr:WD40 repeat-like protein [Serendipita vermifera]
MDSTNDVVDGPDVHPGTGIQVSRISVTLKCSSGHNQTIKLIANKETIGKQEFNHKEVELRWELHPPYTFRKESNLTVQVYERAWFFRKQSIEASASFEAARQSILSNVYSYKIKDDPIITLIFEPRKISDRSLLDIGSELIQKQTSVLDRLGKARKFFETLLLFGTAVSELHPIAKAVLASVNVVHKLLKDQEQCSKDILDLAENMTYAIGYVEDVEQFARITQLKDAIDDLRHLIDDTLNFMRRYSSGNEIVKTMHSAVASSYMEVINKLKSRFDTFKRQFDRGIAVQAVVALDSLLESMRMNSDNSILSGLKPKDLENSPAEECMQGTRQDILDLVDQWTLNLDAPNILWLSGPPGVGKSSIASSVVEGLRKSRRLGSSFFFRRDKATLMPPTSLWRTVSFDLAQKYPTIRKDLVAKLDEDSTLPTIADAKKLFRLLIKDPLLSSEDIPLGRLPVIVIDGLDECGGLAGQYSGSRKSLLSTLKLWAELPRKFKLIVTSRNENDIKGAISNISQPIEILAGSVASAQSSKDIQIFLEEQLGLIAAQYPMSLSPHWPGPEVIEDLVNKAAGLFLWAKTVVRFIECTEPQTRLAEVLKGNYDVGDMGELYTQILKTSFPHPDYEFTESFQSFVGTIVLAKVPLPLSPIKDIISVKETMIEYICNGLHSVLNFDSTLSFRHSSFVDFLVDQTRCPPQFHVDCRKENRKMTQTCIQVTRTRLRFNICNLSSLHFRNVDVSDIVLRIENNIPLLLHYASCFWAEHLVDEDFDPEVLQQVKDLLHETFLFWLEVLSLIGFFYTAQRSLWCVARWIMSHDVEFTRFLSDGQWFVRTFEIPCSQSMPHIYWSALSFSPQKSIIRRQFSRKFISNVMNLRIGGLKTWETSNLPLSSHDGVVYSVCYSQDNKLIASGSEDMTVRVWNATTGEAVGHPFSGHKGSVTCVAFSPISPYVLSSSEDATIRIWSIETGKQLGDPLTGHKDAVLSLDISQDGRRVASGSADKTIRIWNARTGDPLGGPLHGHEGNVSCVAFSPDGGKLVSGSYDKTVRVWNLQTNEPMGEPLIGHTGIVFSVSFSPDGQRIASGSQDKTVWVWDANILKAVMVPLQGHSGHIYSVAFSPDGQWVLSGSHDKTARIWNASTGEPVGEPLCGHHSDIHSVSFSPDGQQISSGSEDKTVQRWDVKTRQPIGEPLRSNGKGLQSDSFSLEMEVRDPGLPGGSPSLPGIQKELVIDEPLYMHTDAVFFVAFSPDGKRIASGSRDETGRIWSVETGQMIGVPMVGHKGRIFSIAYSPNGEYIISGSEDETIRVWNAETGEPVGSPLRGHTGGVNYVDFSPNSQYIVSGSDDSTTRIWDVKTQVQVGNALSGHEASINCVAFSPDGQQFASGSQDQTARVWRVDGQELIRVLQKGHEDSIIYISFSKDGQEIITGSWDGKIQIWERETGVMKRSLKLCHDSGIYSFSFSPDRKRIASGSRDGTIRVWDADTGDMVGGTLYGHNSAVFSISFSPDGKMIASGSRDKTVRLWSADEGDKVGEPSGYRLILPSDTITIDGWVVGKNSELLFWVPPNLRDKLPWPRLISVLGTELMAFEELPPQFREGIWLQK